MTVRAGSQANTQALDEQADSIAIRWRTPWSRMLGPSFARVWTAIEGRLGRNPPHPTPAAGRPAAELLQANWISCRLCSPRAKMARKGNRFLLGGIQ